MLRSIKAQLVERFIFYFRLTYKTTSCAYRIGVIDSSGTNPEPSVYITDKNSDLYLIARLAPFILADTIPMAQITLTHSGNLVDVQANYNDRQRLFSAALPALAGQSRYQHLEFVRSGTIRRAVSLPGDEHLSVGQKHDNQVHQRVVSDMKGEYYDAVCHFQS